MRVLLDYTQALEFAEKQVLALAEKHPDFFPIYTVGGNWHHGGELWTDWTGGFLAGMMWQFHAPHRQCPVAASGRALLEAAGTPPTRPQGPRSGIHFSEHLSALVSN